MILVYDTETTGLPLFSQPAEHPSQPHIVQLGSQLYQGSKKIVSEINLLIKPNGWTISDEAAAIHGISQEQAERFGVPLASAMKLFLFLADRADLLVAHNHDFDCKMARRELHHLGRPADAENLRLRPAYCTMKQSTNIVKLPGRGSNMYKWPSLQEAHTFFCGIPFDGAHDAMAEVRACAAMYFRMVQIVGEAADLTEMDAPPHA